MRGREGSGKALRTPLGAFFNISWRFIGGILFTLVVFCFWPIPVFSHQAGDLYREAVAAIQNKEFHKAETTLQQAIQEFPSFPEAHHLLGMVQFHRTQNAETAIPALQQAIQLNPHLAQAHYDLGLLFLKQEHMEKAQQSIQQALTIYPRFWEARLTLAKMYDQRG